jgi:hypothetical protein
MSDRGSGVARLPTSTYCHGESPRHPMDRKVHRGLPGGLSSNMISVYKILSYDILPGFEQCWVGWSGLAARGHGQCVSHELHGMFSVNYRILMLEEVPTFGLLCTPTLLRRRVPRWTSV